MHAYCNNMRDLFQVPFYYRILSVLYSIINLSNCFKPRIDYVICNRPSAKFWCKSEASEEMKTFENLVPVSLNILSLRFS